jgi:hypothetical protein
MRSVKAAYLLRAFCLAALSIGSACITPVAADPKAKLVDAEYLLNRAGRVMQARREIDEVIADCQKTDDKLCLGNAYRQYGILARVSGGKNNPVILILNRNEIPKPTAEELDISDGYFQQALTLFQQAQQIDLVLNVNFLLANNQVLRGTPLKACAYYDQAAVALVEARKEHPERAFEVLPGQSTPEEGLVTAKKQAGCPVG